MTTSHPKSISVTFAGINPSPDFGDPNKAFDLKFNSRSDPNAPSYTYSHTLNGIWVNVMVILTSDNTVIYQMVRLAPYLDWTPFYAVAPGLVIPNQEADGGTATIVA